MVVFMAIVLMFVRVIAGRLCERAGLVEDLPGSVGIDAHEVLQVDLAPDCAVK